MTNSQRLAELRKKRKEEEKKSSSTSTTNNKTYKNSDRLKKLRLERNIGFDTFEADLNSMGTTIQGIYDGWQTQDTMSKTKTTVEAMQARINAYQEYQKMFGGADLSELANSYKSALDNWDNVSTLYSQYKDADSYSVAKKNAMFDEQFKGLTYDDVQSKLKEYATDSDEYKYLSGYTNYSDLNDFDAALKNATGDYKSKLQKIRNQYALDNKFDLYKGYTEAEDFGEKSQYWDGHSWATDNFTSARSAAAKDHSIVYDKKSKTYYVYSDPLYEYVNDKNNARNLLTQGVMKGDYSKLGLEYSNKGYDKLTDEEIAVFNYIDATEGHDKAVEYLEEMSTTLTKRKYDKQTQDWNKAADSGVLADIGLSIATVPANIVGAMGNAFATVDEFIKGEEYNPYHRYRRVGNFASDTRGYISENIAEATEGVELFGQNVPSFLYDTGMSIGDTALGTLTTGKFYSLFAGTNAYQQKAKEMVEAGEDESKVFFTALASGAAETVFEYLSIDKLLKIKNVDSAASLIKNTLKQAGVEGSEELFTEIANIVSDSAIRGKNSELYQMYEDLKSKGYSTKEINTEIAKHVGGQIGWSFTGGALSGGVMGGGASAKNYSEMSSLGKSIKGNDRTADMLDIAGLTPQESETYKAYTSYANKGINADNISNARLGNLYATTDEGARKTLSSKKSTLEQKRGATETLKKLSVVDEQNTVSKDTISQIDRNIGIREAYMESADELIATGLESGKDTKSYKLAIEYKQKLDNGIELTEKEIANLVKANSEAITAEDVATLSEEDAALFKSVYDGKTDKSDFFNSFELVKTLTENNYSADYILEHKGVLSAKQVSEIYKAKVLSSDASLEKAITALKEKHEGTDFIEGTFNDSVINYDNTNIEGKVNWNSLNSNQKKAIAVLGQVGKRAGMDVELISDGLERGINGAFEISGNKMLIDIYAGMDKVDGSKLQDTIIPTTSHEMTHWMKSKSPTLYRKYDNYVFGTLTMSGKSEADILAARRKKMEAAHPGEKFTDAEVRDEVIARASEDMFAKSEEIKKFLSTLTDSEKKSFVEKVKEILQNVKEWLNDFLSKQKSTSDEAKIIRQYADRIDEQIKLWDEMLISSISANQALKKEGITGEELAKKVTNKATNSNVQEMARNTNIDKLGYNADNISRANKQGELINDYYYALDKSEWKMFYDEITNKGYLATAIVGTVAPIVVNDKLIIAERLYTGKDAHDYVVTDAYKLFAEDGDTYTLTLLQDALNKGDIDYDTQRIFSFVNRINRSYGRDELLARYNRDNSRFDITLNDIKQGKGSQEIHGDSQEKIAGEGVSLRDKSSVQEVDEIKRSDRDFNYIQTLQSAVNELRNILTEMQNSEDFKAAHDKLSEAVSNGDVENGIKAYKEWQDKSGYAELSQRRDTLQLELENLRKSFNEEIANKALNEEKEAIAKSGLSEADYFRKQAVKEFGYTPYFYDAGYITPNGKMLNFSGEKGKHYGTRGQDHRAIGIIYAETSGTDALNRFMKDGNVRIMAESPGIDISTLVEPTTEQYSTIKKFIYEYANKEYFNVDLTDENGNVIGSLEYENKINPLRIINDIKHYYATGEIREQSNIDKFRYSDRDNDIDVDTQINQSMTMAECKDMIQRAFVLGEIYEWYDGEYKNGEEWLKAQGVDEVALYIENEYRLQEKYLDKIEGINEEIFVNDILEAYLNGTLVGKEKPKPKRLDTGKEYRINDKRFYSPQKIKDVKKLLNIASTRVTDKNRSEVSNARAKILLFAHNKGASELLGLTQAELNKKLRTWGGYPANARDISRRFNNGVADSNKWTGIENCSWLYRSTVTTKDLESLVKEITGTASDYEKLYIARTMLALDTHIDWSWLSFDFDSYAGVQEKYNGKSKVLGFYRNDARKIVVSRQNDTQNTVAHEMGHALDYQWGRDLDFAGALTEAYRNTERITDAETKQFFDNFKIFIDSLTDSSDISSEYKQDPKEVFARFVAKFIQWVDNTGTGGRSYNIEYSYYKDNFTASNYIEFVKLLQEKAMLDSKKVAEGGDVKFSDRDTAYMEAVNNGDMETAQRLVDEAAKASGYNTPKLYHGSGTFGFTKFRRGMIYATASSGVAMGYNRGQGLGRIRSASRGYIQNDRTIETAIENAKNVLGATYSRVTNKAKNDIISNANEIFNDISTKIGELDESINRKENDAFWDYIYSKYGEEKADEFVNAYQGLAYMLSGEMSAEEILENNEWFKNDIERSHERKRIFRELFTEEYNKIKGTSLYPLFRYLDGYEFGDALIDLEYGINRLADGREILITERGSIAYLEEVIESIEAVKDVGIYQLYGNMGNNPLVIDEGKVFWDAIPFEGKYRSTDYIANWAKENGYTSVLFKTVLDPSSNGSVNEYADEYVFFDSEQIKSADPVTYDDNGNVIPLSERFNTANEDIRYSDRDNVSVYDTMGETDRLIKENTQLKEDVERLKERLKLERQITNGNHFNENQLNAVAAHIRNIAKSNYSKTDLVNLLKGVYSYIATSKELNWDDLFSQAYDVASMVLSEAKPVTETNEYYKWILNDIRGTKISVNEQQIQNARYKLGNRWRNSFFNKVKITDNAISLDRQWQEWSDAYPDLFDAEISDADMLIELYDIYDSVREGSELVVEYDTEEQTRWLAREIYNQYWNVSPIRTTAEKYTKQIKLLNYKHRESMNQLRSDYEDRLKTQHKADRQKAIKLVKEIRERKDNEIATVKKHSKERMDAYKDNAARKTKIQSITAKALTLNEWLIKNSKEKHIHESLKAPVANLLQAIDFSSKRLLDKNIPTQKDISFQKALSQVKDMMLEASVGKEELVDLYGHDLDDDIKLLVESVDNIMRKVGDNEFILNQMTLNDLNTLDNMLKTIKQAVTKMNQFHSVHHARGIASLGQEEIRYAEKLGNEKVYVEGSLKSGTNKMLKWTNSVPYYAFKRFGEAGKKIFEAFQDGWDKLSFNVKEVIDFTKKTYTSKEVKAWEKEIKSFDVLIPATDSEKSDPNYKQKSQKVQMTTAQVMYLYLLNKRASAKAHLLGGGIVVSNIETKKNEVISQPEGVLLEQSEIDKIIQSLNKRQIEVANALSKFMNTVCSDWGNEVSMARFGYKAFGEPDYVPMQVDKDEISTADPAEKNNSLFKLLNMSFTKSLTEGANNRLVISSIFDVFAQHTSDMAKYNALALPVLDAFKWYNYKEIEYVGEEAKVRNTVKKSIGKAFGKDGQSYITTLLEDINGQNSLSRDKMSVRFFKNAKLASVGMNLRVILLQPTSYFRASANIDNKYLIKALAHKPKIAHAEKYCGMALWKSLGYYDTNIQRGVAEQIKHAETGYDKLVEWSMKGAGDADRLTLGYLWNAAELEIRKTRKDLKVGSEEFFLEVGKRLRDIIYSTQVVDSTLTRSEFMRSPDGRDKILSMFASEPTLAYNILQDAYIQTSLDARELGSKKAAFKKNGKKIARAITAYTVTNAVAALVESGFDILRDDDDEEMDIAEFMKLYLANFAADMSIVGKVPYLKDGLSILQGYSPSRSDLQWIESAYKTYTGIAKHLQGEGNPVTTAKNFLKTFSYVSGLPFYNAYRDIMATLDKLDILSSEELEEMFKDLFGIE